MVLNVADALAAYKQGGNMSSQTGASVGGSSGGSFSDMLKDFTGDAIKSLETGEKASMGAVTGKADITSVVTAISDAELMLQTIVTIRDKVVQAYQTISQSAI